MKESDGKDFDKSERDRVLVNIVHALTVKTEDGKQQVLFSSTHFASKKLPPKISVLYTSFALNSPFFIQIRQVDEYVIALLDCLRDQQLKLKAVKDILLALDLNVVLNDESSVDSYLQMSTILSGSVDALTPDGKIQ